MALLVLSLGTNIGTRDKNLQIAREAILKSIGPIVTSSAIYETEPWGYRDQAFFYNQVIVCDTPLAATEVFEILQSIEIQMGRTRYTKQYTERIIDIDILFYDSLILTGSNLEIPHPKIQDRKFILVPLCEILPYFVHPIIGKPVKDLLNDCSDSLSVIKLSGLD